MRKDVGETHEDFVRLEDLCVIWKTSVTTKREESEPFDE